MTYGFDVKSNNDPFLAAAERALATMEEAAIPGAFLVDTFPICTQQRETVIHPLNAIHSEIHSFMVPWSQVQTFCTKRTEGFWGRCRRSVGPHQRKLEGVLNVTTPSVSTNPLSLGAQGTPR